MSLSVGKTVKCNITPDKSFINVTMEAPHQKNLGWRGWVAGKIDMGEYLIVVVTQTVGCPARYRREYRGV